MAGEHRGLPARFHKPACKQKSDALGSTGLEGIDIEHDPAGHDVLDVAG